MAYMHPLIDLRRPELQKADDYFQYILEEEEAEEEEEIPEIRPVERKHEKSTKKAEDAVLLQDVLTEYFS